MSHTIEFKIVTPEKVLYKDQVESVSFPTIDGEITVLPHHIPLIAAVKPGELKIKKDNKEEFFSVTKGVVEIDGKTITFLTDAAERAHEVDEKRAAEAVKRAQAIMSEKRHDEEGYADAVAQMEKALSRIRIAKKHRHGGGKSTFNE